MRLMELELWVDEVARLTTPDRIHWCDGTQAENDALNQMLVEEGTFIPLNSERFPNSFLARSAINDVSRTEGQTYICTSRPEDAGPTNNWKNPQEIQHTLRGLFRGCMRGRTMYVVPYLMGPPNSPHSRVGVELTDSPYVVANMRIMTRMGQIALDELERQGHFVKGLHSIGLLDPQERYICHFPEEESIISFGSNYGGNALLGKKCFALRLASAIGRREGWMAEHMLILGITDPQGRKTYITAAFPSACGQTNLAMLKRLAMISPGCGLALMGGCMRLTLKPASSVWLPGRVRVPTQMPWPRVVPIRSSPTSRCFPIRRSGGKV
jgi:phosphoenolpyruvate carboxykinase (GTP)